jgi:hypothetical protein
MNETRREAYLKLIVALLNCPSGDEGQILDNNQDLVDPSLVQTMEEVAEKFVKAGDQNGAYFLFRFARRLAGVFSQRDLLLEALQVTSDSNANSQEVYPLLQANLDKLDDNFAQVLRKWATTTLSNVNDPDEKEYIVTDILNFSVLIRNFPLGTI